MTADLPESADESTFEYGMIGKYRITYEHGSTSCGAWSEDVPGRFAIEKSRSAVGHRMGEAIEFQFSEDEDEKNDREDGLEDNHETLGGRPEAALTDLGDEEDDDLDVPPALAGRIFGAAGREQGVLRGNYTLCFFKYGDVFAAPSPEGCAVEPLVGTLGIEPRTNRL